MTTPKPPPSIPDSEIPDSEIPEASPPQPFVLHDESAFMHECADRLNAFLQTYPAEAQHVLGTYIPYEHELVDVYEQLPDHSSRPKPPGIAVGALFAALLQTHMGTGYVLRAVIVLDPDATDGCFIEKFIVEAQSDHDTELPTG